MKRILLTCSMIEDEIRSAIEEEQSDLEVIWFDRGLHNTPEKLQAALQDQINRLQGYDEILLGYGLCGNGTAGLVSRQTVLVVPKFDDCINMMLCKGKRTGRGLVKPGIIYVSGGWTRDERALLGLYEDLMDRFDGDEEMVEAVIEMTYANYHSIALLDTGCFDKAPVEEYIRKSAEIIGLETTEEEGGNEIMKQLIRGHYDNNFIVLMPGEILNYDHFNL